MTANFAVVASRRMQQSTTALWSDATTAGLLSFTCKLAWALMWLPVQFQQTAVAVVSYTLIFCA